MSTSKNVRAKDLVRGIAQGIPSTPTLVRGLLGLAALRPESKMSIGRVLEYWAWRRPRSTALTFENRSWSYREFNQWVNQIAACYEQHGVRSGDTVAILMHNRPEALACVAAAVKLGAIAGLLNHNQRSEALEHSLKLIKPKILVAADNCIEQLVDCKTTIKDIPLLWQRTDEEQKLPRGWKNLETLSAIQPTTNPQGTADVRAKQACFYIFTSGTTGLPKASVMTHYRWLASAAGMGAATLRLNHKDVFYMCLPLYHNNALTVSWSAVLSAGACMALDTKFSASQFWQRVIQRQATAFCYIGELLRYLLNRKAGEFDRKHSVRLIVGNGLRADIWQEFEQRFGITRIYEFYGASESNIAFINAFGVSQTAGFSPLTFAIVEFAVDSETPIRSGARQFMQKVKPGGVGLLISEVSERRPFDGYTDDESSNKKLFHDVFENGDCWLNSGDLVRDQGFRHIEFVDRVGDTFRWKGENVSTGEVEGVLATDSSVAHAAVYGVTLPGFDGRAGMAALTLHTGKPFNGTALYKLLQKALPAYAVPLFIRLQSEHTATTTFKSRKVELKREGFDLNLVSEPLYVLMDKSKGYVKLNAKVFVDIQAGAIRF